MEEKEKKCQPSFSLSTPPCCQPGSDLKKKESKLCEEQQLSDAIGKCVRRAGGFVGTGMERYRSFNRSRQRAEPGEMILH